MQILSLFLMSLYALCLLFLLIQALGRAYLLYCYHYKEGQAAPTSLPSFPAVTIQLPLYNEPQVVEQLLNAIVQLDYPSEQLHIQVLDDSTDQTSELVRAFIASGKAGDKNIVHITRSSNIGYKAGALQYGLERAKGEYIVIFDSDFVPEPQFLQRLLPEFVDERIGMVQAAWGHQNRDHSQLTKAQAFGLDAHFSIEQKGRNKGGVWISFNGTAGIWRKSCILDAGGWQHDTLTEDLDLSYRAQLKGWKFRYVEELRTPAELPITVSGIRSQQYRWTKGAVDTLLKLGKQLLRAEISWKEKCFGLLHLSNPLTFPAVFFSGVLSVPLLWVKFHYPEYGLFFQWASVFLLSFLLMGLFYRSAYKSVLQEQFSGWSFLRSFLSFLSFSVGLSWDNSRAVWDALRQKKIPFIRTPKMGYSLILGEKKQSYVLNSYVLPPIFSTKMVLFLYFLGGVAGGIVLKDYGLIPFHLLFLSGFGMLEYYRLRYD